MNKWKITDTFPDIALRETIDWLFETVKAIKGFGDKF